MAPMLVLATMALLGLVMQVWAAERGSGETIAEKHPGDSGIANDPDVVLAEDFDNWSDDGTTPPADT